MGERLRKTPVLKGICQILRVEIRKPFRKGDWYPQRYQAFRSPRHGPLIFNLRSSLFAQTTQSDADPFMKQFVLTTLLTCLLVMCSLVLMVMAIELYKTRNQLNYLKTRDQEYAKRIQEVEQNLAAKEEYLDKLLTDPVFLERVVRERLGYTRPEEWIYRFPEETRETTQTP